MYSWLTITALILSGNKFATYVAPAVENPEAPRAAMPLMTKHRVVNCVSSSTYFNDPKRRLQLPHRNTPDINMNFGPIVGIICPIKGEVQNTTAG